MRGHYGALDAVDGLPLRADPLSDVSSGSDGRWWGRGQVFSRRLDVDDPVGVLGGLLVDQGLIFVLERPRVVVVQGS